MSTKIMGKNELFSINLNIKNVNINIKHLRKTNHPYKTLPPGNQVKKTRTPPAHLLLTPNR